MSVKKFRFVSPGVFINEIDNSQLPASPAGIGPLVIGRARSGPGLRPTQVNSFSEFVTVFGNPVAGGGGENSDIWRDGNTVGPTYGPFAAQAYLRNSSPLTYIRLLGAESPDKTTGGEAGWATVACNDHDGGGAYGLWVFNSSSNHQVTGALAAVFYVVSSSQECSVALTGTLAGTSAAVTGTSCLINSETFYEYKMMVKNHDGANDLVTTFNFNENSSQYIRKVFNTNPQLTNAQTTDNELLYWLGESYERHLKSTIPYGPTYAALMPMILATAPGDHAGDLEYPLISAQTPWFFSQDVTTDAASYSPRNMANLFRIHALDQPGAWTSQNLKISIEDVKASTNDSTDYGTFAVVVRRLDDSDNVVQVVEQYNDCNLNPNSLNYLARKIGDVETVWDDTERRYRQRGQYGNNSKYIRVEMDSTVDRSGPPDAQMLPFGVRGIVKYADVSIHNTSSALPTYIGQTGSAFDVGDQLAGDIEGTYLVHDLAGVGPNVFTASMKFPAPAMRVSASDGGIGNFKDAYFGFAVGRRPESLRFERSNLDLLRPLGGIGAANQFNPTATGCEASDAFTLDDIVVVGNDANWSSGSRAAGTSRTAAGGSWEAILDSGFDRFTAPLHSGFDGLDIVEPEPFNNTDLGAVPNEFENYAFNSIKRAIDSVADPEAVEMNLATIPGLTQAGLTTQLLDTCEARADALAVIDLEGGYVPVTENTQDFASRRGSVGATISALQLRGLNSSYGCSYYPWVQMRDSITGMILWAPPSIAALGVFSSSQRRTEVWFAPAGFNRGGLTVGAAGVPIINVVERLTRKDRDNLYEANINPIAKFPAEGLVIFGQKTLQVTPSALDRINVRRLLIFLKKRISQIATQILFEPNIRKTWDRFTGQVNPFLEEVKTNFGLSDYKLVLDDTTTTPELVDRNILYAKIFLKPTKAIEYIALDFNITRTGASFVD